MDPTEKGWFLKYIELRPPFESNQTNDSENSLYNYFQNTGIMYGHPLNIPDKIKINYKEYPVKERMKVILAETFIYSIENIYSKHLTSKNFTDKVQEIISNFYTLQKEEISSLSTFFSINKSAKQNPEEWFNKRIYIKSKWKIHFWNLFFYNILLYADTLQFTDWLRCTDSPNYNFSTEKTEIRITALKVIAAAANCNQHIEEEEKRFYNFFLESAELDSTHYKKAKDYLNTIKDVEDIQLKKNASWLQRKYYLDLAILCLWADKNIGEEEEIFLKKLCKNLELNEEDLESSRVAIESFVLNNWENIHFLKSKQHYSVLSQRLVERLKSISFKYKNQIGNEISESKELVELLAKSTNHDLTIEEKEKIRLQLIDILKSIPTFVYLSLPFTFFTLPIIFKILPKSVFPSAFDENRLMQKKNRKTIG